MAIESDPLALAIAPPRDESPSSRWQREQAEAHARQVSSQIDDAIRAEKVAMKKGKKPIRVLLLGQSQSGKTTVIKNFQMTYAYDAFVEERAAWRTVIHMNLVRSVVTLLDILQKHLDRSNSSSSSSARHSRSRSRSLSRFDSESSTDLPSFLPAFTTELHSLLERLAPLRDVKANLERTLGASSAPATSSSTASLDTEQRGRDPNPRKPTEFFVHSRVGWRAALERVKTKQKRSDVYTQNALPGRKRPRSSTSSKHSTISTNTEDEASAILSGLSNGIHAVWTDPTVQAVLSRRKVRLEEGPGFFLNDTLRITSPHYVPTDDDIVRARLRTIGVQEYHFFPDRSDKAKDEDGRSIEASGKEHTPMTLRREWILYDVGGCRSSRHVWTPFFDDINAIIFLAPINCFDERLAEDKRVNRLEDSLLLWKAICENKILRKVQFILFLNKCDLLQKKIARGVRVAEYVATYGDKPNEAKSVAKFFRQQFRDLLIRYSPEQRGFYSYLTSAIDTKATSITIAAVRDGIQRNHLKEAEIV